MSKITDILWTIDTGASNESVEEAEQAITDLINEAIGPDEPDETLPFVSNEFIVQRNQLRADIRTKLGLTKETN